MTQAKLIPPPGHLLPRSPLNLDVCRFSLRHKNVLKEMMWCTLEFNKHLQVDVHHFWLRRQASVFSDPRWVATETQSRKQRERIGRVMWEAVWASAGFLGGEKYFNV